MSRDRVTIAPTAATSRERSEILERARRRGFARFLVTPEDSPRALPGEEFLVREQDAIRSTGPNARRVPLVRVGDPASLGGALQQHPANGAIAIEWTGDRVIPLENAIATLGTSGELWVMARTPREVPGALGALEHGAHRVIVSVRTPGEIDELESLIEGPLAARLDWTLAPVNAVRPVGVGDRVLVDTTSLLDAEEGLLVGSAAGFLFHVASEAVGSEFSRPRPFRVNAGAAHSYVLLADGSTRYLSELEAGDAVLACRPGGSARAVRVGRVKIERRPLVLVSAEVDGTRRTIFLQEAETVRLSVEGGRRASTALEVGTRIHGVRLVAARHLGTAIEETITER